MKTKKEFIVSFSDQELAEFVGESGRIHHTWQKIFDSAFGSCYLRLYSLGQLAAYSKMRARLVTIPLVFFVLVMLVVLAGLYPSGSGLLLNHDAQLVLVAVIGFCSGGIFLSFLSLLHLNKACKRWRDRAEINWYRGYFSELEAATECSFIPALEKSHEKVEADILTALKIRAAKLLKFREALQKVFANYNLSNLKQALNESSEAENGFSKLYLAARRAGFCSSLTSGQILAEVIKEAEEGPTAADTPSSFE